VARPVVLLWNVPEGNQGFLRSDARLAVFLVTNEDDCSLPDDSDLADPTTSGISLYGPLRIVPLQ
jgi:hypothetical protein